MFRSNPTTILILVIALALIVLYVGKRFGWTKTAADIKRDEEEAEKDAEFDNVIKDNIMMVAEAANKLRTNEYFEPDKWRYAPMSAKVIPKWKAQELAKELRSALTGIFGDDEAAIMAIFTSLTDPYQISQISDAYVTMYGGDLRYKLLDDLAADEIAELNSIIEQI